MSNSNQHDLALQNIEVLQQTRELLKIKQFSEMKPSGMAILTRELINLAMSSEDIVFGCAKTFNSRKTGAALGSKFIRKVVCSAVYKANNFYLGAVQLNDQLLKSGKKPSDAQINLLNNKFDWFASVEILLNHMHHGKGVALEDIKDSWQFMMDNLRGYTPAEDVKRFIDGLQSNSTLARMERSIKRKHRTASDAKIKVLTEKKVARQVAMEEARGKARKTTIEGIYDELEHTWLEMFKHLEKNHTASSWDGLHATYARTIITKAYDTIDDTLTYKEDLLFRPGNSPAFKATLNDEADNLEGSFYEMTGVMEAMERIEYENENATDGTDDPHDVDLERGFGIGENPDLTY